MAAPERRQRRHPQGHLSTTGGAAVGPCGAPWLAVTLLLLGVTLAVAAAPSAHAPASAHAPRTLADPGADKGPCNATTLASAAFHELVHTFHNQSHSATVPYFGASGNGYQQSLDSLFTALAYAHFDQKMAEAELRSVLSAQWTNGMLPSMVYFGVNGSASAAAFPTPAFWDMNAIKTKGDVASSGVATLPFHATVVLNSFFLATDTRSAMQFLQFAFPKLYEYHAYLYTARVVAEGDPLVYIRHPSEALLPASPAWQHFLPATKAGDAGAQGSTTVAGAGAAAGTPTVRCSAVPAVPTDVAHRADFAGANATAAALCVAKCAADHGYNEFEAARSCGYAVQSVTFNAVLARANSDLATIGEFIEGQRDKVAQLRKWANQTAYAVTDRRPSGLFDTETHYFYDRNVLPMLQDPPSSPVYSGDKTVAGVLALLLGSATSVPYVHPSTGGSHPSSLAAFDDGDRSTGVASDAAFVDQAGAWGALDATAVVGVPNVAADGNALDRRAHELLARLRARGGKRGRELLADEIVEGGDIAEFAPPVPALAPSPSSPLSGHRQLSAAPGWEVDVLCVMVSPDFMPWPLLPTLSRESPFFSATAGQSGSVWLRSNFLAVLAMREAGFVGMGQVLLNYSVAALACKGGFNEGFAAAGDARPLGGGATALGAATTILLSLPMAAPVQPTPVPLEWWGIVVVLVAELVVVTGVGVMCLVISARSLKNVREHAKQQGEELTGNLSDLQGRMLSSEGEGSYLRLRGGGHRRGGPGSASGDYSEREDVASDEGGFDSGGDASDAPGAGAGGGGDDRGSLLDDGDVPVGSLGSSYVGSYDDRGDGGGAAGEGQGFWGWLWGSEAPPANQMPMSPAPASPAPGRV